MRGSKFTQALKAIDATDRWLDRWLPEPTVHVKDDSGEGIEAVVRPVEFTMAPLYPKQREIINDHSRFVITEATTKAGKTMSHLELLHDRDWETSIQPSISGINCL